MSDNLTPEQISEIQDWLEKGQKLSAIKKYKEFTGCGLREAKEFIDALWPQLIEQDPQRFQAAPAGSGKGCAVFLVFVLLLGGVLVANVMGQPPETIPVASADTELAAPKSDVDPYAGHDQITISDWTCHVERRLIDEQPKLWQAVRRELHHQLYQCERRLPQAAYIQLRNNVPIWIDIDDGRHGGLVYHPNRNWLKNNGLNPEMARCVAISNAGNFVKWSLSQPFCVMHELAHAWHDQCLPGGFGNQRVLRTYERAKNEGLYGDVLHIEAPSRPAYAAKNQQEFFAESTEAYFGTNDFYPFVRAELIQHDPETAALIKRMWNRPATD